RACGSVPAFQNQDAIPAGSARRIHYESPAQQGVDDALVLALPIGSPRPIGISSRYSGHEAYVFGRTWGNGNHVSVVPWPLMQPVQSSRNAQRAVQSNIDC